MPYNPSFGAAFSRILDRRRLYTLEEAYIFFEGMISKATISNWQKGMPAPRLGARALRRVIQRLSPEEATELTTAAELRRLPAEQAA
jgi:hypothetical protein